MSFHGKPTIVIGYHELERTLLDLLPRDTVHYNCAFRHYDDSRSGDDVTVAFDGLDSPVRARFLLGCDGPSSRVRKQCLNDGDPSFDDTVLWVGRLPGDQVATTPCDHQAWWVQPGQAFISHPMKDGDVAWEAAVNVKILRDRGYVYDESQGQFVRQSPAPSPPAGQAVPELDTPAPQSASFHPQQPRVVHTLMDLFQSFPEPVKMMLRHTHADAVLEMPVYIRPAKELPSTMGRGRVLILGEAAHPLRPTGQDENMALEDAAELGACIQALGMSKEALRRVEQKRRGRWKHVMQVQCSERGLRLGCSCCKPFVNLHRSMKLLVAYFKSL